MTSKIISFGSLGTAEEMAPPADRIVSGEPRQSVWNAFSSPDGCLHLGQWRSSRGAWRVRYNEYELCHLLQGRVRLCADDGQVSDFSAGDTFMIDKGFSGIWEVVEDCLKLYAIYEPKVLRTW